MHRVETATAAPPVPARRRGTLLLLAVFPLVLVATTVAILALVGAPGLDERRGPPAEVLVVERTVLRPGTIELTVRNDGPDPMRIAQVSVNDAYVDFTGNRDAVGRLEAQTLRIPYPWVTGEGYEIFLLTSTGGAVTHEIPVAVETPGAGLDLLGLATLLGLYVGIIPVAIGMLWAPFVRNAGRRWLRGLMAFTVGLLGFLALDSLAEGVEVAGQGSQALGGPVLVFLGAALSYLTRTAVDAWLRSRRHRADVTGGDGGRLALLVAVGIGVHNLGEGLAIGSAYAVGELVLGVSLVIGFAVHNSTEGFAIVAVSGTGDVPLPRLAGLGLVAGAPVVLGTWVGTAAFNPAVAALLLGVAAGAVVQVIQQLLPAMRDPEGRTLDGYTVGGVVSGLLVLYATGLLVGAA